MRAGRFAYVEPQRPGWQKPYRLDELSATV